MFCFNITLYLVQSISAASLTHRLLAMASGNSPRNLGSSGTAEPGASASAETGPCVSAGPSNVLAMKPLLTVDDARDCQWSTVSHKQAHDVLNWCRWRFSIEGSSAEAMDLTDDADFDWRAYLAGREDFEDIIGTGVVAFHFQRFPWKDPNTGEGRTDFVVSRADGTAVRLHPQQKKNTRGNREAVPVYGTLEEWLEASSSKCKAVTQSESFYAYVDISQADMRGSAEAEAFLQKVSAEWQPGQRFWRSLRTDEFPWPLYLAQNRFQRFLRGEKVTVFGVVWHKGLRCACFWGRTVQDEMFHITPKTSNEFKTGWPSDLYWC